MKLRELNTETTLFELRCEIKNKLSEAINKHLQTAAAQLSNRGATDKSLKGIDIDQLASIIAGMKVLSKNEYRDAMTKDDIGINLRNSKEFFSMLDQIPDAPASELTGLSKEVINSLTHVAPSIKRAELVQLNKLISNDPAERKGAEAYLKAIALKIDGMYAKIKTLASAPEKKAA